MSHVQTTFHLTGKLAGKTIKLGSLPYAFQDGVMVLVAPVDDMAMHARFLERNWQAYPEGHPALQAQEKTDGVSDLSTAAQPDSQPPVQRDLQPNGAGPAAGEPNADGGGGAAGSATGEAGSVSDGNGQPASLTEGGADTGTETGGQGEGAGGQEPGPLLNEKLQRAVFGLDPANDAHWTRDGKPALVAVTELYGATDVTRAQVEEVAPGYTRSVAKKMAAGAA